jgi:PAS domain S-box-containing protein
METLFEGDVKLVEELAGVGFFRVDADRNVTAVSPELERITGFSAEEVVGKPCFSLIRCPTCLKGCGLFEQGRINDARLGIFLKDGSEVEVVRSGICLTDEDGEITGAVEALRVVPEECGAGGAPAAVEALMGGLGRMFIAADGDFRVRAFSSQLAATVGKTPEDLTDLPLSELLGEELFGEHGLLRQAVIEGRRKEGWRASLPSAEGGRIPISLSVGPLPSETRCGHPDVRLVVMMRRDDDVRDRPLAVPSYHGIVGRSRSMQRIFRLVDQLGDSDSTVLITGESGTGKELVARAIHATSQRSRGPFVAVNCAALPAELLESELFGHVRGAFTGAVRDRAGRFEMADGGTLFLDEIGDLDPSLQAKILRALQDHTFERVGDSRSRTVDVRVIAATHVDVGRAVAERRFREDLYYRLRVIPIEVPPLRDRREDLPTLIAHLLDRMGRRHQRALRLSPQASRALLVHDWPGNVRELENALEFAVTVCEGQTIHVTDLPNDVRKGGPREVAPAPDSDTGADAQERAARVVRTGDHAPERITDEEAAEARRIEAALLRTRYNRSDAAAELGMSRTTLWRKMKTYRL